MIHHRVHFSSTNAQSPSNWSWLRSVCKLEIENELWSEPLIYKCFQAATLKARGRMIFILSNASLIEWQSPYMCVSCSWYTWLAIVCILIVFIQQGKIFLVKCEKEVLITIWFQNKLKPLHDMHLRWKILKNNLICCTF